MMTSHIPANVIVNFVYSPHPPLLVPLIVPVLPPPVFPPSSPSPLPNLSSLAVDFFNQINMLYGTITEHCSTESCPVMSAGPKYVSSLCVVCRIGRSVFVGIIMYSSRITLHTPFRALP